MFSLGAATACSVTPGFIGMAPQPEVNRRSSRDDTYSRHDHAFIGLAGAMNGKEPRYQTLHHDGR